MDKALPYFLSKLLLMNQNHMLFFDRFIAEEISIFSILQGILNKINFT